MRSFFWERFDLQEGSYCCDCCYEKLLLRLKTGSEDSVDAYCLMKKLKTLFPCVIGKILISEGSEVRSPRVPA